MDLIVDKMLKYQRANGGTSLPSAKQIHAERTCNNIPFATIIFIVCIAMGVSTLLYTISRLGRQYWLKKNHDVRAGRKSRIDTAVALASRLVMLIAFATISYYLYLLKTINGSLPMANKYDIMLLSAWTIMLLSLVVGLKLMDGYLRVFHHSYATLFRRYKSCYTCHACSSVTYVSSGSVLSFVRQARTLLCPYLSIWFGTRACWKACTPQTSCSRAIEQGFKSISHRSLGCAYDIVAYRHVDSVDRLRALYSLSLFISIRMGYSACRAVTCLVGLGSASLLQVCMPNGHIA